MQWSNRQMPWFAKHFEEFQGQINTTLASLQGGTRMLQQLCNHLKGEKDASLLNLIPACRRELERVIFAYKQILGEANQLSKFVVANLKHKSLTGETTSSQYPIEQSDESEKPKKRKKVEKKGKVLKRVKKEPGLVSFSSTDELESTRPVKNHYRVEVHESRVVSNEYVVDSSFPFADEEVDELAS
jgi:hypothetical protein